ncbi:MAG: hypothetical protein JXR89_01915 [Deltaproteobacteria bacterium]|nr:hypothetical protein [Deltaproteobacteria bacterium]
MKIGMNKESWRILMMALLFTSLFPPALWALQGGPDRFGYRFIDSRTVGGPAYEWENLEKSGTKYEGFDKPEFDYPNRMGVPIDIGFQFKFYGNTYRAVYLAANGYLAFSTSNFRNSVYDGSGLPSVSEPNNLIAPFWGWLDTYS